MTAWSTDDVNRDDQTGWLTHLYEKTVSDIRAAGAIPSATSAILKVPVPTLHVQAEIMRFRDQLPPGHNTPTGMLDWLE